MSLATVVPNSKKLEICAHYAGVAVDGLVAQTENLERFSEEVSARLEALEATFKHFQTPGSVRKSIRG